MTRPSVLLRSDPLHLSDGVTFYTVAETAMLFFGLPRGAYETICGSGCWCSRCWWPWWSCRTAPRWRDLDAPDLREGDVPSRSRMVMRAARSKLAGARHVLVILLAAGRLDGLALEIDRGFERLAGASFATIAIITGCQAAR